MKTNGPNSPQTIRGLLNRRSERALLDTRWQQEADILTEPMAGPFGKGFHRLLAKSGAEYIVGDVSGKTWAPNAQVMVANPMGAGDRAVIGGAPPNRKGGAARTRDGRRRGSVTPDAVESNQYAFGNDGSNTWALLYSDGTYVSTRDATGDSGLAICGCILTDPTELVGNGSALAGGSQIIVWDVENATSYGLIAATGYDLAGNPYYYDGRVYYLEIESGYTGHLQATLDVRLRSAATDLTDETTVATVVLDATEYDHGNGTTHYDVDCFESSTLMVDSNGAVFYLKVKHDEPGHGFVQYQHYQFRVALIGGAESHREYRDDTYPLAGNFCATPAAGNFYALSLDGTTVYSKGDDATTEAAVFSGGMSGLDGLSINVGAGGSTLQAYVSGPLIYRSGVLVTSSVDDFDGTNRPLQMFYFGS